MKLGRLPADSTRPKLMLAPHLTVTLPDLPSSADYLSRINTWPMYGNDRYGCCVWAMIGHYEQSASLYGAGTEITVPDSAVLKGYADVTGWNPNDPDTDQGTVMQDAMDYWRKTGVGGHKIVAFASVTPTDHDEVKAAIGIFGAALIGFNFPAFAWDQFDAGKPWDVSSTNRTIEGGHAVHVGRFTSLDSEGVTLTTWGQTQKMTWAFWDKYVDEVWVVITQEWVNAAGKTPTGIDLYGLGGDFAMLTGGVNPFPAPEPVPTPPPDPTPTPVPPPVTADDTLAAAAAQWLTVKHRTTNNTTFEKAVKVWLASRTS